MTPQERQALAEQIASNPLFTAILDDMQARAVEMMVYAPDDDTRRTAAWRVQAIRNFRADLGEALSIRQPRSAPA